jgi:hypothetical protein
MIFQGEFVLHIDIFNDRTFDGQPYPSSERDLILSTTIRSSIWPNSTWQHSQTIDSSLNAQEFSFRYRVSCATHFYGSQCARFCSPLSIHSRCDAETGEILCQQGWTGVDCNQGTNDGLALRTSVQLTCCHSSGLPCWLPSWSVCQSTEPMPLPHGLDGFTL